MAHLSKAGAYAIFAAVLVAYTVQVRHGHRLQLTGRASLCRSWQLAAGSSSSDHDRQTASDSQ